MRSIIPPAICLVREDTLFLATVVTLGTQQGPAGALAWSWSSGDKAGVEEWAGAGGSAAPSRLRPQRMFKADQSFVKSCWVNFSVRQFSLMVRMRLGGKPSGAVAWISKVTSTLAIRIATRC